METARASHSSHDVTGIIRTARGALGGRGAAGGWSRDPELRQGAVTRLADRLRAHKPALAELISRETHKVLWESQLEVDAMVNKCGLSIRAEQERRRPTATTTPAGTMATTYRPHGVALVLGPFNFPGHLPLGHIVPALLAGNAVIFKPSEKAPRVGDFLGRLLEEAGVPPGVMTTVQGGAEVATALVDGDIDAVLFTGSYSVGTSILARLASRPGVMTALELGGNNPLIAWDVSPASVPAAVVAILQSAFATAGQRCSCARRLIVHRDDPLVDAVVAAARRLRVGAWDERPQPFYSGLISSAAVGALLAARKRLYEAGAGSFGPFVDHEGVTGNVVPPIVMDVPVSAHLDEEVFGPLLQIYRVESFDEALAFANATRYGLVAGLLTDNLGLWERFRIQARAGVLTLNRPTVGASSELPFGGVGDSGNHRPSAYFAADYCSYPVAEMSSPALALPATLPPGISLS